MAQLLVRKLDEQAVATLKRKAKAAGISLEEFARRALQREADQQSDDEIWAAIDAVRERNGRDPDFDSTAIIRDMRDRGWPRD